MADTLSKDQRPNIYSFADYRAFLREIYLFEKQKSDKFSYRVFSARAGFKSPNFLKLVIEGQRNLTEGSVRKVAAAFKLSPDETTFFRNLVQLNQAESPSERSKAAREMYKSKVFRDLYPLQSAQLAFYQNWYCVPIREMVASPAFKEDPQWIAGKLRCGVTAAQVSRALEDLQILGLIRRGPDGRLEQAQPNISTGNEVASAAVVDFHKQMIAMASESIDSVKRYRREISSSTVLISENTFGRLKEMIQEFRKLLIAEAELAAGSGHAIYQVNFQLFPLTEDLLSSDSSDLAEDKLCKKSS